MFLKTLWRLRIWYRIKVLRRVLSWSFRHFDFRQLILQLMILPSVDLLVNWPYSQLIFDAIDLFDLWSGGLWPFWPLILLQIIFGQMIFDTIELSTIDLTYRWSLHFWSFWHLTFLQLIFHQLIFLHVFWYKWLLMGVRAFPVGPTRVRNMSLLRFPESFFPSNISVNSCILAFSLHLWNIFQPLVYILFCLFEFSR